MEKFTAPLKAHCAVSDSFGAPSDSVGFLDTHPSDDDRIANLVSAIEDVRSGVPLELSSNPLSQIKGKLTNKK